MVKQEQSKKGPPIETIRDITLFCLNCYSNKKKKTALMFVHGKISFFL